VKAEAACRSQLLVKIKIKIKLLYLERKPYQPVFMQVLCPGRIEFGVLVFVEGGKPGEKSLEQGREPTTNSTHI